MITFEQIKADPSIRTYIQRADESLIYMGFTEHSFAHVGRVAETARYILLTLGYTEREAELAQIAGYLHDIGNVVNRIDHAQSGAVMAFRILDRLGADPEDIATIIAAIGNHDEHTAEPIKRMCGIPAFGKQIHPNSIFTTASTSPCAVRVPISTTRTNPLRLR